jgi:hypothetical protein
MLSVIVSFVRARFGCKEASAEVGWTNVTAGCRTSYHAWRSSDLASAQGPVPQHLTSEALVTIWVARGVSSKNCSRVSSGAEQIYDARAIASVSWGMELPHLVYCVDPAPLFLDGRRFLINLPALLLAVVES